MSHSKKELIPVILELIREAKEPLPPLKDNGPAQNLLKESYV
jgi:hypothetical protein